MLMQSSTEPSASTTQPAMGMTLNEVGKPISRIDGRAKVTGTATYAAEPPTEGVVHGVIVSSTIASGSVTEFDASEAEKATGVIAVISHKNRPTIKVGDKKLHSEDRLPFADDSVRYAGQHIAVVIAETLAQARDAVKLIKIKYKADEIAWNFDDPNAKTERPKKDKGEPEQYRKQDPDAALAADGVMQFKKLYITPRETHNPMEMSATVAVWADDEHLVVWDATQAVMQRRQSLAETFGIDQQNVRVICPYVGGGFGCKGDMWPHATIAAMAAKAVKKPVKIMLTRQQMFTGCGHRPVTTQEITVGATKDGKLVAIRHDTTTSDGIGGHHIEDCAKGTTGVLYETPTLAYTTTVKKINIAPATFMRAPGECPGMFGLESAMDEMAEMLKIDPLEFRRINHAEKGAVSGKPFSAKHLLECYDIGAQRFGWSQRKPEPGSMKGPKGELIGWGVATATYPAHRFANQARIRLMVDAASGKVKAVGQSATQDLGTGSWTIFTQMVADLTGLPLDQSKFELGDSNFPPGAVSGGSQTAAGVGQALTDAAAVLKGKLLMAAGESPLKDLKDGDVELRDGKLFAKGDPTKSIDVATLIGKDGKKFIEGNSSDKAKPSQGGDNIDAQRKNYTFQSFGVHFVEVVIDQPVPLIRVNRVVSVMDVGRIINPKTARSQVLGGVVMGIGMALMEETIFDPKTRRPVNNNLADYPVPVNPDIHAIDVQFIDKPDPRFNAMGCRGVGEIGITGIAAAIANAAWHATGKRFRELPITPDKLLETA